MRKLDSAVERQYGSAARPEQGQGQGQGNRTIRTGEEVQTENISISCERRDKIQKEVSE
ncbi:hypothetical protein L228DRAFT_248608 [Xylona heveae TC161]|uniref:Uncharacterized protein n=1 Tax=Xylona heveae (strain CBS 132557 / TC161) TaxID=1328760 RepID=A0A165G853_XYLHT|nr:hypothetical protein L228DRAFT_248608 [Xylona heveae TC161]KZF21852.1 hypothetical protein L228DRAFT_248608 [Xylona heveae TC161]